MQRTGTTSVGNFFRQFGYPVCGYETSSLLEWSFLWEEGRFEEIFASPAFQQNRVFEDDPWWMPHFYRFLAHRFPTALFVHFTRPADDWFRSMLSHSNGQNPGNTRLHSQVYQRLPEYYALLDSGKVKDPTTRQTDNWLSMHGMEEHYTSVYNSYNRGVQEFFERVAPQRYFHANLSDTDKWQRLGNFTGLDVPAEFEVHSNASK